MKFIDEGSFKNNFGIYKITNNDRLYNDEGYTQQEIADIYGKTRAAIGKTIQKLRGQEHHKTIQCQAS